MTNVISRFYFNINSIQLHSYRYSINTWLPKYIVFKRCSTHQNLNMHYYIWSNFWLRMNLVMEGHNKTCCALGHKMAKRFRLDVYMSPYTIHVRFTYIGRLDLDTFVLRQLWPLGIFNSQWKLPFQLIECLLHWVSLLEITWYPRKQNLVETEGREA